MAERWRKYWPRDGGWSNKLEGGEPGGKWRKNRDWATWPNSARGWWKQTRNHGSDRSNWMERGARRVMNGRKRKRRRKTRRRRWSRRKKKKRNVEEQHKFLHEAIHWSMSLHFQLYLIMSRLMHKQHLHPSIHACLFLSGASAILDIWSTALRASLFGWGFFLHFLQPPSTNPAGFFSNIFPPSFFILDFSLSFLFFLSFWFVLLFRFLVDLCRFVSICVDFRPLPSSGFSPPFSWLSFGRILSRLWLLVWL